MTMTSLLLTYLVASPWRPSSEPNFQQCRCTDTSLAGKGLDSKNEGADSTHVTNQPIPQDEALAAPLERLFRFRKVGTHPPTR